MQPAIDLIKRFEGCRLTAYKCPAGIWTIGYGYAQPWVTEGCVISQGWAERLLEEELTELAWAIKENLPTDTGRTHNQTYALISFVYNVGIGAFKKSTLRKKIIAGDIQAAADEFLKWDKAGGQVLPGLTKRRQAERELFLTPEAPASLV